MSVAATHDPLVMSFAKRQVNLRDGMIAQDSADAAVA